MFGVFGCLVGCLLCFALLCSALLCSALLCFALLYVGCVSGVLRLCYSVGACCVRLQGSPTIESMSNEPTTLEIVNNIVNGNRKDAAEQIMTHSESVRMAIAVLCTLATDEGHCNDDAQAWQDAATDVVRTLNAGDRR